MSRDMASPSASTPGSDGASYDGDTTSRSGKKKGSKVVKARLTAVQKNTNHKDAENKRRNAIRERFTELASLVPDAFGQERSEQVMLTKTRDYLKDSIAEIRDLEQQADNRGIHIKPEDRLRDDDWGGSKWREVEMHKYEAGKVKKGHKVAARRTQNGSLDAEAEDDAYDPELTHPV